MNNNSIIETLVLAYLTWAGKQHAKNHKKYISNCLAT